MAPARVYASPSEQLVELLASARERGMTFEEAWAEAIRPGRGAVLANHREPPDGALRWPTDTSERIAWRTAILTSRDTYRRAYVGRPMTRRERAVLILVAELAAGGIRGGSPVRFAA